MDVAISISEGKLCFETSKLVLEFHKPILTTLFEMGCIAPMDNFENPIYYSQYEFFESKKSVNLIECD